VNLLLQTRTYSMFFLISPNFQMFAANGIADYFPPIQRASSTKPLHASEFISIDKEQYNELTELKYNRNLLIQINEERETNLKSEIRKCEKVSSDRHFLYSQILTEKCGNERSTQEVGRAADPTRREDIGNLQKIPYFCNFFIFRLLKQKSKN
jgi:hypothetical protein